MSLNGIPDLWSSVTESATSGWADMYLPNYEDIQVVQWLRFYR